ncbi:MAG: FAD-binding oxidoreductase [Ignavibacteria bacterium]|nr:FAD-binding oxidoreductase [Ignavibacteria bacterium]
MRPPYLTIERGLKETVRGECFFDAATRETYSTASCWYKILPVAVVFPQDIEDVQSVVRFCCENGIAVVPRGGGTGLAGQAIGFGVIVDFTRHMNRLLEVQRDTAVVQPGLLLADLNDQLRSRDLMFPIDPASSKQCTIGGMIATNAAGAHGVKYGAMKDHVESLLVVLANGELATIRQPFLESGLVYSRAYRDIYIRLRSLLTANRDTILQRFPQVLKNSSGYNLYDAVRSKDFDLRKIIVGSEGTLAAVVQASLHLTRPPPIRLGAAAYFTDYRTAAEAVLRSSGLKPSALEILDSTYLALGQELTPAAGHLLHPGAQAMLYIEFDGELQREVEEMLMTFKDVTARAGSSGFLQFSTDTERKEVWHLREAVSEQINCDKWKGKTSFIEDVAVPLEYLADYIVGLRELLSRHQIPFCVYGHAGGGNIHCATFVDLTNLEQYRKIDLVASEVADLAISLGGTLSGEHGDGFVRTPFLERLYGPEIYGLFKEVKYAFDPTGILNPGKIIGRQNTSILHDLSIS